MWAGGGPCLGPLWGHLPCWLLSPWHRERVHFVNRFVISAPPTVHCPSGFPQILQGQLTHQKYVCAGRKGTERQSQGGRPAQLSPRALKCLWRSQQSPEVATVKGNRPSVKGTGGGTKTQPQDEVISWKPPEQINQTRFPKNAREGQYEKAAPLGVSSLPSTPQDLLKPHLKVVTL